MDYGIKGTADYESNGQFQRVKNRRKSTFCEDNLTLILELDIDDTKQKQTSTLLATLSIKIVFY